LRTWAGPRGCVALTAEGRLRPRPRPEKRYSSGCPPGVACDLVQSGARCTMTSTLTPKDIRLTITVTPEVHATFQRFAKAAGMSLGRAMGEWLGDTLEGAELLAAQLERARAAPKAAIREMHAFALGLTDETNALMRKMTEEGRAAHGGASAPSRAVRSSIPPSSNTGGKGLRKAKGKPGNSRSAS
jgi:hypothetical protein